MRERPIIFSGPMIRAILENRKTQTRRVIKPQPPDGWYIDSTPTRGSFGLWETLRGTHGGNFWGGLQHGGIKCPHGVPGDKLWLRETWTYVTLAENEYDAANPLHRRRGDGCPVLMLYRAHEDAWTFPASWTPSIFMPRWASRIMLEIVGVSVERVREISEADCKAEGVAPLMVDSGGIDGGSGAWIEIPHYQPAFVELWDSINKKRGFGWDTNCWVWVVEFKRINDNG